MLLEFALLRETGWRSRRQAGSSGNETEMKANELKKGMVFDNDGRNIVVKQVQVQAPSSRSGNTLYKVRGHDVATGQKF